MNFAVCTREWAFEEARRRAVILDEPFAVFRERKGTSYVVRSACLPMLRGLHWELIGTVSCGKKKKNQSSPATKTHGDKNE
jgi:hypothetical protein